MDDGGPARWWEIVILIVVLTLAVGWYVALTWIVALIERGV